MSAVDLIRWAASEGMTLQREGDRLRLQGDHPAPADLLEALRTHKAAVLDALTSSPTARCPACGGLFFHRLKGCLNWYCSACHPMTRGDWSEMTTLAGYTVPASVPDAPLPDFLVVVCQELGLPLFAVPADFVVDLKRPGWEDIKPETLRAHLVAYFTEHGWPCH